MRVFANRSPIIIRSNVVIPTLTALLLLTGLAFSVTALDTELTMTYSSYFGGSSLDLVHGMAVDSDGNVLIVGVTQSDDFPVVNAYQEDNAGGGDSFLTKMSSDGQEIVFSTYIGGTEIDIVSHVAIDSQNNIIVSGETHSNDFPIHNAYQDCINGTIDCFLMKFDPFGNILYATYFGGSAWEIARGLAFDVNDNLLFSGHTTSSDFPVSPNAYQTYLAGEDDVYIVHFANDGQSIIHSTFLGGSEVDGANHGFIDDDGNYIICGRTGSSDFPTTVDAYQSTSGGAPEGFIAKFNVTGQTITYSSYLGGNGHEYPWRIGPYLDSGIVVVGNTNSSDFPLSANAYQSSLAGSNDGFILGFNRDMTLNFSTLIGGLNEDDVRHFDVGADGSIVVGGCTSSADFPTTSNAYQFTKDGYMDSFVLVFDSIEQDLVYSTFIGGNRHDYCWGLYLGTALVIAGSTDSTNFPILNPYQVIKTGDYDAYVSMFNLSQLTDPTCPTTPDIWNTGILLPLTAIGGIGLLLIILVVVFRKRTAH